MLLFLFKPLDERERRRRKRDAVEAATQTKRTCLVMLAATVQPLWTLTMITVSVFPMPIIGMEEPAILAIPFHCFRIRKKHE